MGTIRLIRVFFLLISVVCGYYLGSLFVGVNPASSFFGMVAGFFFALFLIFLEIRLREVSLINLSAGLFGLAFGIFVAWLLTLILRLIQMDERIYSVFQMVFTLIFCYLGMAIAIKGKSEFNLIIPYVKFSREDVSEQVYLLDTSVIIDGRIAGICETGFVKGKLVVPRFVLQELQQVADSADDAKRTRGRRGLDMLNALKKAHGVEVIVHDEHLPHIKEVDAKLVRLAKILDSRIITNDFNLNKVARIEGLDVLNINDLANAMRLVVLPGEEMNVTIKREGKEKNQGVAFFDDGTMIVVENARRLIGRTVNVTVSSVLQTSAGRMIFANLMDKNLERQAEKPQEKHHERHHERHGGRHQGRHPEKPQQQQQQQAGQQAGAQQQQAGQHPPQQHEHKEHHHKEHEERQPEQPAAEERETVQTENQSVTENPPAAQ